MPEATPDDDLDVTLRWTSEHAPLADGGAGRRAPTTPSDDAMRHLLDRIDALEAAVAEVRTLLEVVVDSLPASAPGSGSER